MIESDFDMSPAFCEHDNKTRYAHFERPLMRHEVWKPLSQPGRLVGIRTQCNKCGYSRVDYPQKHLIMIESGFDMPTEQYVRSLRNFVFESPASDTNWDYCGEHWSRPDALKWLEKQAVMIKAREVRNRNKHN